MLCALAIIVLFLGACGLQGLLGKPDNAAEEIAESMIEDGIEKALDLPDGSMEGKIDFTPSSEEDDD